jgi:glycosyltransferase involved in cell wall biosynthesis
MTSAPPEVSFVIPIYNEEAILHAAVVDLRERLAPHGLSYELILAENGSSDRTADIARELCDRYPELRLERSPTPNYGHALRHGIDKARGSRSFAKRSICATWTFTCKRWSSCAKTGPIS